MKEFSLYGVTGLILLDERKKKKNNLYPVKYRLTYKRKLYYSGSGIDLSTEDWKILESTKKRDLIEKRNLVIDGFDRIVDAIKDIFKKENAFSFEALDKYLNKGTTSDLFKIFENTISSLQNSGRIGSAIAYKCALTSIKSFWNKDELQLQDVNTTFLQNYESWMLVEENKKSYTTIGIYIRQLRAIYNVARKDFPINESSYPFGKDKYEIPSSESIKKALTIDQIRSIYNYPLKPGSRDELYRDIWFFSYLCNGINMYDICLLKYSNIDDNELKFYRHKTIRTSKRKKLIQVALLPEIQEIINKWGNKVKGKDNYIFPFINLEKRINKSKKETLIQEKKDVQSITHLINNKMKKIGEKVGVGDITTYTARHSFATVLKRGGASHSFIGDSLGHAQISTTESYLDSFEKETRTLNAQKLTQYK